MASSDEILQAMIDTIEAKDDSTDVRKGPFYDMVLKPVADEIAPAYDEVTSVENMMSSLATGSASSMSSTYLSALGTCMRVSKQAGRKAVCKIYLYFTTLPSQEVTVPAGTSVATSDGKYIFTTDNAISGITATTAVNYYRPSTGRYEIPATVTATSEGSVYNVPANRLVYLPSVIDGIDGVYNPVKASGGQDAEDSEAYLADIRAKFIGADTSSTAGITSKITSKYGTTIAVNYINSDSPLFARQVQGTGLDIYVNTPNATYAEDLFVTGSSTTFTLTKPPVLSVEQVTVNGTATSTWEFVKDTTLSVKSSPSANDCVVVSNVTLGDIVRVTYTYDATTRWIVDNVLSEYTDDYFGIDGLARLAEDTTIWISCTATAGSSTSGLIDSLRQYLIDYVTNNTYGTLDPVELASNVLSDFTNLRKFTFQVFGTSETQSTRIRALVSSGVEAFVTSTANIVVTVA